MTGCVGYLRVYEPLEAFPEAERARWSAYVAARRAPERREAVRRERTSTISAVIGPAARLPAAALDDEALVTVESGQPLICPLWTRLRARTELLERSGVAAELMAAGYPQWVGESALQEERAFRERHPAVRPSIVTCVGQLPLSWFVAFEPREAYLELTDAPGGQPPLDTGRVLVYRTAMTRARQRVARALHVLRGRAAAPLLAPLEDLGRWLEEFHPHALVELDYADFAHAVGAQEIMADDSVALVRAALEALGAGDVPRARAAYERVSLRWRELAIRQTSN